MCIIYCWVIWWETAEKQTIWMTWSHHVPHLLSLGCQGRVYETFCCGSVSKRKRKEWETWSSFQRNEEKKRKLTLRSKNPSGRSKPLSCSIAVDLMNTHTHNQSTDTHIDYQHNLILIQIATLSRCWAFSVMMSYLLLRSTCDSSGFWKGFPSEDLLNMWFLDLAAIALISRWYLENQRTNTTLKTDTNYLIHSCHYRRTDSSWMMSSLRYVNHYCKSQINVIIYCNTAVIPQLCIYVIWNS